MAEIDVFNNRQGEFFCNDPSDKKDLIDEDDPDYMCSLEICKDTAKSLNKIMTKKGTNKIAAFSDNAINIFDITETREKFLEEKDNGSGSSDDKDSKDKKSQKSADRVERPVIKPDLNYTLDNKSYDFILDFQLNSEEPLDSLVCLASREFSFV